MFSQQLSNLNFAVTEESVVLWNAPLFNIYVPQANTSHHDCGTK